MSKKLENLLALHSSLAICGLKPSNLFSYYSENIEDSIEEINALNEKYKQLYNEVFKESLKVREGDGIYICESKEETYKPEPDNMSEAEYKKYKRGKK